MPGTPQFGATKSADVQIHVTTTAGPFLVTRPNTALTWGRGETHLVTWDVAGTAAAPVNCSNVAIDLSTDGGQTWPFALSSSMANIGTANIVVPGGAADSSQARVRVSCVDNLFFDVSDVNFSIAATGDADPTGAIASISPTSFSFAVDAGATTSDVLTIANVGDASTSLNYTVAESNDACATTSDVSWLAATPTSGAVAGASSAQVSVSVDASLLGVGSQSASVCVGTDDPAHVQFVVPIGVVVSAPADDEIFKGRFRKRRSCAAGARSELRSDDIRGGPESRLGRQRQQSASRSWRNAVLQRRWLQHSDAHRQLGDLVSAVGAAAPSCRPLRRA